ncbi:LAFE_0D08988g1_1 [Lachancea fermentati]|uniref:LAFE_0D08988g1_1 n=1 Tax=Lachancea fermentati TaxID=4955 RepID=A0A1G4MBQ8_LACFM|nr:LAFE_0D08988g1_1 [Lachancea fermentati]
MSNFWDNNKGSIMNGITTAGKYGFQGTKFVAKAGYKAGKQHYNSSKNRREGKTSSNDSDNEDIYSNKSPSPVTHLVDPSNFAPPPLRAGQKQYRSDGSLAEGLPSSNVSSGVSSSISQPAPGSQGPPSYPQQAPVVNMPQTADQQWAQRPQPASATQVGSRPLPFQPTTAAPAPIARPILPSRTNTAQSYTLGAAPTAAIPTPSQGQYAIRSETQTAASPAYISSPQPTQQSYYAPTAVPTAPPVIENQPVQMSVTQDPPARPITEEIITTQNQSSLPNPQLMSANFQQVSPVYERPAAVLPPSTPQDNTMASNSIYAEPPHHRGPPPAERELPMAQGRLIITPREKIQLTDLTQVAPEPLSQSEMITQEIEGVYGPQISNSGVMNQAEPTIPDSNIPSQPHMQYGFKNVAPSQTYSRPAAMLPHEISNVTQTIVTPVASPSPQSSISIQPHDFNAPKPKIEIPEVDVSALPPPPVHSRRSESPILTMPSSKPPSRSTTFNCEVDPPPYGQPADMSHSETAGLTGNEIALNNDSGTGAVGVAGRYANNGDVAFPPPPKPSRLHSGTPSTSGLSSSSSSSTGVNALTPRPVPSPAQRKGSSRTSVFAPNLSNSRQASHKNSQEDKPRAAVLGIYDYNVKVNFEPPPKPFRRGEEVSHKMGATQSQKISSPMTSEDSRGMPPTIFPPSQAPEFTPGMPSAGISQTAILPTHAPESTPRLPPTAFPPPRAPISHHSNISATTEVTSDGSDSSNYVDAESDNALEGEPDIRSSNISKKVPPVVKKKPKTLEALHINDSSSEKHSTADFSNELANMLSKRKAAPPVPIKKESLKKPPAVPTKKPSLMASSSTSHLGGTPKFPKSNKIKTAAPVVASKPKFTMENLEHKMASVKMEESGLDENDLDDNPFRKYLKAAVPPENDRLHK